MGTYASAVEVVATMPSTSPCQQTSRCRRCRRCRRV